MEEITINLKTINEYIDVKLLLITISVTMGFLYCSSNNNFILKRKY